MYAQGRLHGYRSHGEASNGDRYGYLPRRGRQVRRALGRAKLARLAPATWRRSQIGVVSSTSFRQEVWRCSVLTRHPNHGLDRPDWLTIEAPDPPDDVLALLDHHLLDLGGTYGDPSAGDPIHYDELRIEHDQGDVEIIASRRGGRPPSRNPEESGHAG